MQRACSMETAQPISKDIEEGKVLDRVMWVYVSYNWETKEKKVFLCQESPELSLAMEDNSEWHRMYKVQVGLPFPAIAVPKDKVVIEDLEAESIRRDKEWKKDDEPTLHAFARRLWGFAIDALPAPWRPVMSRWLSSVEERDPGPRQFTVERDGVKLVVTVTEVK